MKIFAIGDLHLSLDPRIEKPMDVFGKSWENHTEKLNNNWNSVVSESDIVIVCGDLSWGLTLDEAKADLEFIRNLNGTKLFYKGNHDLWWQSVTKNNALFKDSEGNNNPKMNFMQNKAYMVNDLAICGTRGWTCPGDKEFTAHDKKIYEREVLRLQMSLDDAVKKNAKEIIAVLHYPPTNDKKQASGFTDMLQKYNVKTVIYGHLHGEDNFHRGLMGRDNGIEYNLCSIDYLDCMPKLIKEI